MEREGAAVTCDGRLFHIRAAATGNTLSPTVDRRVTSNIQRPDIAPNAPIHSAGGLNCNLHCFYWLSARIPTKHCAATARALCVMTMAKLSPIIVKLFT